MFATILQVAAMVAVAFVLGGVAGYAFRGKEHSAIASLGQDIKKKL